LQNPGCALAPDTAACNIIMIYVLLGSMDPSRQKFLSKIVFKAMFAGLLANILNGCMAGKISFLLLYCNFKYLLRQNCIERIKYGNNYFL